MRAITVALVVVMTGLSLSGCSRRHSLFMEPGKPEATKSGQGRQVPPPAPKTERQ